MFQQATIDEHEKEFDPDNPRDLIDEYLLEMKNAENTDNDMLRKGGI